MKIQSKFKHFYKESTLHGMLYFYKSKHWLNKLTWCLIMLCSCVFCGYLSYNMYVQYIVDPTVTLVEATHYPTSQIQFPAVVVCDSDLVYGPRAKPLVDILLSRNLSQIEIDRFFETLSSHDEDIINDLELQKTHQILTSVGYPYPAILDMVAKPCNDLLLMCMWRSQSYPCSDMFRRILTHRGYCCQFDIQYFKSTADNETCFTAESVPSKALQLIINGNQTYVNLTTHMGKYTNVYILDSRDNMTIMENYLTMVSGFHFDVALNVWLMSTSDHALKLHLSTRKCITKEDDIAYGSYSACVAKYILMKVTEKCRCKPFYYVDDESLKLSMYPPCIWIQYKCIYENSESFRSNSSDTNWSSNCYQKCDAVWYTTTMLYTQKKILSPFITVHHLDNNYQYHKSDTEVSIHFAESTCMKYKKEVLFTWDQMLANIGGIFGLCLGGSIISIIELITFVSDLFITAFKKKILNKFKKIKVANEISVFTIGKKLKGKSRGSQNHINGKGLILNVK